MKTQFTTEKKKANLIGTCTAEPLTSFKKDRYLETQFYIHLKDGRTLKVYAFNRTAAAALANIKEQQHLIIFGNFIASDSFRMTSFKKLS
jgi:hypothetical protein